MITEITTQRAYLLLKYHDIHLIMYKAYYKNNNFVIFQRILNAIFSIKILFNTCIFPVSNCAG
jgi:hypothetical protein